MKALFVHTSDLVRTRDGEVFSSGSLSYQICSRYLKYFDRLTVIGRMSERAEAPVNWNLASGSCVTFAGPPNDHAKPLMQLQVRKKLQIIRREMLDCEAVIVRQSPLGWLAAREATRRGIPCVVEVISDAANSYWNYGTLLGKLYAPIAWWNARRWIRQAEFAVYVTREYLQKKYPCRGVSCGVSDVQIDPVPASVPEEKIKRWNGEQKAPLKNPRIGMIGSLFNRYKGLHVALRALRILLGQGMQVHLYVLGKGKLDVWHKEAEQLGVADLLHFDGCLPSGEPVMQWLDGLDIYIQPSFQEGLPRALIEAMSRGLPSLGSTCGGIPELLPQECLHHPGDDKTLAKQLARMVTDYPWRIQQARRNFSEARSYYRDQIEARRDAFWGQFVEFVKKKKGPFREGIAVTETF